ncbi:MAG: glycerol-3-phosphate dehydrogenase [Betaproteobacteria bacterium]|nr:glycerol-3-phosphate dehydrogenase [Betaproteobacteria bacterium]
MDHYDLLVIGGGINGAGVARDAAGRGLKVLLVETHDLGAATSSSSSKLIHGGLRYLERYEFRLVAEALAEREVLLAIAPHLVAPLTFAMPHVPELRPRWMIRTGLFLYDHLGRRTRLPASRGVDLRAPPYESGLKATLTNGFVYSDCRVDDARLVLANALSARELGADILTRTECVSAKRAGDGWEALLRATPGAERTVFARGIVNAAGPWVKQVLNDRLHQPSRDNVKLVKGSHIVVPKAYHGEHALILQNDDRRVVFMIPYEGGYTLIGTTDVAVDGDPSTPSASADEIAYLCRAVNRYLAQPVAPADVVWSYAGIRPLYDDGTADPSAVTRDYTLRLDADHKSAPVLSVFGGKITTYRRLAEHVLDKLAPWFPGMKAAWTAGTPLPGGDLGGTPTAFGARLAAEYASLPVPLLRALARRHGSLAHSVLQGVRTAAELGVHFGADLYAREIDYMIEHEWACSAEDILYRRTKAGLHLAAAQREALANYISRRAAKR